MANKALLSVKTKLNSLLEVDPNLKRNYYLFLLTILVGYAAFQSIFILTLPLTYDEGLNLQVGYLINQGYEPYTQIFTLANPLFVWLIGWLGKFGLSPIGFKWVFLLFSLLLLVNVFLIAKYWLGNVAALTSIFLLVTAPTFMANATTIVAVIPALSIGTLSLVLSLFYLKSGKLYWQVLSGLSWSLALFISTTVLTIAVINWLFIILSPINDTQGDPLRLNWAKSSKAIGLWLVGAIICLGIGLLMATPDVVIHHIFANQSTIRHNLAINQDTNFELVGSYITTNFWLMLFAIIGLAHLYNAFNNHPLWIIVIWGTLSLCCIMLRVILPLTDLNILLPPVAIVAGWGVAKVGQWLVGYYQARYNFKSGPIRAGLGIVLGVGLYFLISWSQFNSYILQDIGNEEEFIQFQRQPEIVQLIQQHTKADDCVVIDDAALAIAAKRLPIPQLAGLTKERIASGLITEAELKTLVEAECAAVVFSNRKYTQPFDDFKDWAKSYFPHEQKLIRTTIYYK